MSWARPGLYTFVEHVSVLNSQSVLRNDITSYALDDMLSLRFVLSRVFFSIYSIAPYCVSHYDHVSSIRHLSLLQVVYHSFSFTRYV